MTLEYHLYLCLGYKPYVCDGEGCGQRFYAPKFLTRHKLVDWQAEKDKEEKRLKEKAEQRNMFIQDRQKRYENRNNMKKE
jgi:hypothetical protein